MSSRLNPRDYDLGELRDAVRETSGRRDDDDGADRRRDPSRRDDPRSASRAPEGGQRDDRESGGSGDRQSEGDGGSGANHSTGSTLAERRVDDRRTTRDGRGFGRSVGAHADGHGDATTRRDDRASAGRLRQNTARFARSTSRDRTADGEPRRRPRPGDLAGTRRRTEARSGRSDRSERPVGRGTDAFELLSPGGDIERPYLARLPDSYDAQVEIFEWLEGLLATCGRESTLDALEYYESVGWLSGDSRESLEGFVQGLTAAEPPEPRSLDVDHHRESLRYVARLARRSDR